MSFNTKNLQEIVAATWVDELDTYKISLPLDRLEYVETIIENTIEWERKLMTYMEEYEETHYLIYNILKLKIELKLNEEQK